MNKERNRYIGIDIVKVIAVFLVITIHFFLNTNYYDTEPYGISMIFQKCVRNFAMICVPLFLITTGFLNNKTQYNKKYFKGLSTILIIWLFYSVIEYFTLNILHKTTENLNLKSLLFAITSFTACQYSWYIEMFIGLYVIVPILNNAFNDLDDTNKKRLLMLTILIIILPSFINNIFNDIIHIPSWWINFYPIAYYILGKYLAYKQPKFNKKILFIMLIFGQALLLSYSSIGSIDYGCVPVYINSVLVFLMLYNIKIKSPKIKSIFSYISMISLDIYLGSSLIDKIIYPTFSKMFKFTEIGQQQAILYAPIIIITVFVLATIYGSIRKKLINIR